MNAIDVLFAHPATTNLVALVTIMVGVLAGVVGLVRAGRSQNSGDRRGGKRNAASAAGIAVQGVAFVFATGAMRINTDVAAAVLSLRTWLVALLVAASLWLLLAALRRMGKEWAFLARTRADHRLVTDGPFAIVRNPIYLALMLYLTALSVAAGHERGLYVAIPIFLLGTAIRIRSEERLLRSLFGADYEQYARRVKRLIPGVL